MPINESTTESEYLTEVVNAMEQLKKNTARRAKAKRRSDKLRDYYNDHPEFKTAISERMIAFWSNQKNRKKMAQIRRLEKDLKHKERQVEGRRKASASMSAFWAIPENKQRMLEAIRAGWQRKKLVKAKAKTFTSR